MNPEKLRRLQEKVRTGGKGSVRRKRKIVRNPFFNCVVVEMITLLCFVFEMEKKVFLQKQNLSRFFKKKIFVNDYLFD